MEAEEEAPSKFTASKTLVPSAKAPDYEIIFIGLKKHVLTCLENVAIVRF